MINPDNVKAKNGFYPDEVVDNVHPYFLFLIVFFGSLTIIAVLLVQPYEEEPSTEPSLVEDSKEEEIDDINDAYASDDYEDDEVGVNNVNNEVDFITETNKEKLNEVETLPSKSMKKKTVKLRKAIFSTQNTLLFFLAIWNYCKFLISFLYYEFHLSFPITISKYL